MKTNRWVGSDAYSKTAAIFDIGCSIWKPDLLTTNICFGGKDLRTAYITLSGTGRVIAMDWARPGLPLHHLAYG